MAKLSVINTPAREATSNAERSELIDRLYENIMLVSIGGMITLSQIEHICGEPIDKCRHLFKAAAARATEEHGAIFESVRKQGYKRIHTEDAAVRGVSARRTIAKKTDRIARELTSVVKKVNDISPYTLLTLNREIAIAGLLSSVARSPSEIISNHAASTTQDAASLGSSLIDRLKAF